MPKPTCHADPASCSANLGGQRYPRRKLRVNAKLGHVVLTLGPQGSIISDSQGVLPSRVPSHGAALSAQGLRAPHMCHPRVGRRYFLPRPRAYCPLAQPQCGEAQQQRALPSGWGTRLILPTPIPSWPLRLVPHTQHVPSGRSAALW